MTEVQRIFQKYTGIRLHTEHVPGTNYATDGNYDVIIIMPAVIRVCKNEYGHALSQAILYYANFLISATGEPHHYEDYDTRFPVILMVDAGRSTFIDYSGLLIDGMLRVNHWLLRCRLGWPCEGRTSHAHVRFVNSSYGRK